MVDCCWAKYEFVAENEDELYFGVGERIEIVERDEAYGDGWWRGRTSDGKEGLFPMSYITEVEPVKQVGAVKPLASNGTKAVQPPVTATPPSPTSPSIPLQRSLTRSRSPSPVRNANGAMAPTITDINKAIDSVAAPGPHGDTDEEEEDRDYATGIGGSTRAKLAEQARLENEQRERSNTSEQGQSHRRTSSGFHAHKGLGGNPAGLFYSDESEDEDDEVDGEREREASMVPSTGFAALAAAAAAATGGAVAAASHMTGGLFTSHDETNDDVVSPKSQPEIIDMPPAPESTSLKTDRRGSFGQALDSPAVTQREAEPVGLAIPTDFPPPPSAPEAEIGKAEPPEVQKSPVRESELLTSDPVHSSRDEPGLGSEEQHVPAVAAPFAHVVHTEKEVLPGAFPESEPEAEPESEVQPEPRPELAVAPAAVPELAVASAAVPEPEPVPAVVPVAAPATPSPPALVVEERVITPTPQNQDSPSPSPVPAPIHNTPNFFTIPTRSPIVPTPQAEEPPASPIRESRSIKSSSPAFAPAILGPLVVAPAAAASARAISPAASSPAAVNQSQTHTRSVSTASVSTPLPGGNPSTWSVDQVVDWARSRGFDDAVCAKFQEHEISGDLLLELDANLLKELEIPQFGKRLRIAQAIGELRGERRTRPSSIDRPASGTASPAPVGEEDFAWHNGSRKGSVIDSPTIAAPIHEEEENGQDLPPFRETAPPSAMSVHSRTSSMPASPVTPGGQRSSSGSVAGHKKNKPSVDKPPSERMSFFSVNRTRKPPPREEESSSLEKNRSMSRLGFTGNSRPSKGPAPAPTSPAATAAAAAPGKRLSVTSPDKAETVVDKIGRPDHSGYMKKKGERYNSWKLRYFILRGPHLYYMKSEQEARIKGHIDLTGHRIVVDENVHSGEYGFRIVGASGEKEHSFSSPEQSTVREWMKALIKATIARDYSAPVVSSCNIPTIPLSEAQAMSPAPRPPSPTQRDATQRASRRENVNQLTPRDATVLMSLDGGLDSGHKRRVSGLGVPQVAPPRPSRELRQPSRRSIASNYEPEGTSDILKWVNQTLPSVKASTMPGSFTNGLVITRLAEKLSGAKDPAPNSVFTPMSNGAPSVDGLFAMMDTLIDHGFDTVSVSPGDVLGGDAEAITRLLQSMRDAAKRDKTL